MDSEIQDNGGAHSDSAVRSMKCSADTTKCKVDFFTPLVPTMCLVSAITTMKSHADSVTEALANYVLGILLIYVALLNLVRNQQNAAGERRLG